MQGLVHVTVILQNPDGIIEKELRAEWEPTQETETCLKVLAALKSNGGIVRFIEDGKLEYTPVNMERVNHIDVTTSKVQLPGGGGIIVP